ncbi:nonsense-mediated mRNA decay factor SMG9 [Lutzomyia longipalpis]|uniref:Uncharacterized protein n=2 Tax=Lutzomyia longipalpis TaxID=7200 RepID=A0A1B0CED2_LUTLO|nr:nonsense-mediated mRNA decay factor SMG9 [Lutzomyia longipalpis]
MSEPGKKIKKFQQQNQQHRLGKKVQIARKDPPPKEKPEDKKPKILLKPREKTEADDHESAGPTTAKPMLQNVPKPAEVPKEEESNQVLEMTKPCELVFSNFEANRKVADYLKDSNVFFQVIGVIGTKGSGKSTILNYLAQGGYNVSEHTQVFPEHRDGRNSSGLQMFITKDRIFLLDFQESFTNEADTIKMIMFGLSLCHVLLIVQTEFMDINLMKHLIFAEMMKFNTGHTVSPEGPNLIFVKNCTTAAQDMAHESFNLWQRTLEKLFINSQLKIHTDYVKDSGKTSKNAVKCIKQINLIEFPNLRCKNYVNSVNLESTVEELLCTVFKYLKNPLRSQPTFTEKMWWRIAMSLVESHKTEYFLRKYDHLTNVINSTTSTGDGHGKDRYVLNYHVDA